MKWIVPFMLFLYTCTNLTAQHLSDFQKVEGLNSNVVYCVMQDSKGYIWVGTEAGAARYDGYGFTFFTIDDGLTDNDVFQIKEDSKGRLWFLNNSGKPCLYDNGKILNANNTTWLNNFQPKKLAIHFVEDKSGSIWYSTLDTAYHIYRDKIVEKIAVPRTRELNNNIQSVVSYKNNIYILHNTGIYNANTQKNTIFDSAYMIASLHTRTLLYNNNIYYVAGQKILEYSLETSSIKLVHTLRASKNFVNFIQIPSNNSLLISTIEQVYKLDMQKGVMIYQPQYNIEMTSGLVKDTEGNLWLNSLTKGLFFKRENNIAATIKIQSKGLPDQLKCWSVDKINEVVYFGFDDGQYVLLKNKIPFYNVIKKTDTRRKILQFYAINNTLNIVNANAIIQFQGKKLHEATFTAKQIETLHNYVYMATSSGLIKYPLNNNLIIGYKQGKYLTTERVSRLLIGHNDSICLGGILGLQLLVKEKKVNNIHWKQPITNGSITKIRKGKNNDIIFSTNNMGIGIIKPDTIYTINQSSGLLSNTCNDIFVAENGGIWIATSKGINKLSYTIQKNKSIQYLIEDYRAVIQTITPNINAILQSGDTLFLAADDGAYWHVLLNQNTVNIYPKLHIEKITINDSSFPIQPNYQLNYQQNKIRIHFKGLAFQAAGKIKYRYKLLPIDTTWQESENTFVEYPYLSSGKYEFVVTAAMPRGSWNTQPMSVKINISKPFWWQWWFLTLVITAIGLAIRYVMVNTKKTFLLEKQSMLMKLNKIEFEKQLTALQQKALTLQMNPHFIFNAINSIKGFYAAGNTEKAKDFINAFSVLLRSMLDTASISIHTLENEIRFIQQYLDFCLMRYNNSFVYHLSVNEQINTAMIKVPVMLFQPIVENAILHGLTPLSKEGCIAIDIQLQSNKLIITIDDNGIGRVAAQQLHSYAKHDSKGIKLVQQRISLLADGNTEFGCVIEDKYDENKIALGTKVMVTIPLMN